MRFDGAIIGGTGTGNILAAIDGVPIHVPTGYGCIRGRQIEIEGMSIFALSRHSAGHKVPPHRVDYSGIARAIKQLDIPVCFATAAVGSLREDWQAGTFAICRDFVDLSARNLTLFEKAVVHTDFTEPFSIRARRAIEKSSSKLGQMVATEAIYVMGAGPRYETPHEIQLFKHLGDVVGMTAASEAVAMREVGVKYACLSIVTNLAAGISTTELNHEEVVDQMIASGDMALRVLVGAVREYSNND